MKNIDSTARSHFLKSCMLSFPYLFLGGIICGYAFGGILGALLGVFAAVLLSMIVGTISMLITGTVGGITSGLLYGRGKSTFSLRERLEGDLQQVRHHKMNKNFDKALELIDGVLEQDPNFPDALFLKAQILWEGFKDSNGAKECLSRVINIVPNKGESIHRWASQLLLEIN